MLFVDGKWSWETGGKWKAAWKRLHEIGIEAGLEPLSFELPHLQLRGLDISDLRAGAYPDGGDESWADNLEAAIAGWSGAPPAPPLPAGSAERPALVEAALLEAEVSALSVGLPSTGSAEWHNRFGGIEWRFDGSGVYVRGHEGGNRPLRTNGAPITCRAIWNAYSVVIETVARRFAVPPELIIMTIAAETAAYRDQGFTGPATFRWEAHVWNHDIQPPSQGDYSAGPMQTLATTARWVIGAQQLPYHRFQVAPVYATRPVPPPATHPLYDPAVNIDIGTAEIKQRWAKTGSDPILVAAAFNAGGIYEASSNAWHLRSYGNHLDRAAKWYGDACAVLKEACVR